MFKYHSFKQEERQFGLEDLNPFANKTIFIAAVFSISPFIFGCVSVCVRGKDLIESLCQEESESNARKRCGQVL